MIIAIYVICDKCGGHEYVRIKDADIEIIGDKMLVLDRWVCNDCIRSEKVKA